MATVDNVNNFTILQRGRGNVLLYAGRQFYRHQTYRNNSTHWRCAGFKLEKNRRCYGSVTISEVSLSTKYFFFLFLLVCGYWMIFFYRTKR